MLRKLLSILILCLLVFTGWLYYEVMVREVVPKRDTSFTLMLPSGATFDQAVDSLSALGIRPDRLLFDPLAERMNWKKDPMRAGRFMITPGQNMISLIRELRTGRQQTVKVVLTTEREPMNVAAKAARFLETDSLSLVRLFQDEQYLQSIGYTRETLQTLFIPNTYELYWNASPRDFVERMRKEHERFWTAEGRKERAEKMGYTPAQIYTLASIVHSESLARSEQPRIAGLYLNRLRKGIMLQSDPTAVFANRAFGISRVLNKHIALEHPYNTYTNFGLPPGPIAMPEISAIDAVLHAEDHDYLYMCAKGDNSGLHNFAKTLAGHNRNIAIYVANLRARGLR